MGEHYDFSASRSYYAVFYAATSLLIDADKKFGKHSGVIAAIHQDFIKTEKLDKHFGRDLNWLFELRGIGDYGVTIHVKKDEAGEAIRVAQEFVQAAKRILH